MRVLLDTNIIIHREASTVINKDIGVLFKWLDNLKHTKCIHPITIEEIEKHKDPQTKKTFKTKLDNYNLLKTKAPLVPAVNQIISQIDKNQNDINDTLLLNELYGGRVDAIITEDKNIIQKASLLDISERVYTIDAFLEKVTAENPSLVEYKVLSARKEYFGNLKISDEFFISLKEDYPAFEKWFLKKSDEPVYVCLSDESLIALLYLKLEDGDEVYTDITPPFPKKRRLKVGTFKVALNGFRLGERFLKIIFDNALKFEVDEIYVTIFDKRIEQQRLINLLESYGFQKHGFKNTSCGKELVYIRPFDRVANLSCPKRTYPFFSSKGQIFIVPIYPDYHTELFPDSILCTESPNHFTENEPHRNAISKVYISRSIERQIKSGDVIIFYRTGGYYKSVVTTIGIVESITDNIKTETDFLSHCRKRSVFTDKKLSEHWNYGSSRPFIVNFLYAYSLPKRINLKRLIEIGIIRDINDAPRGFKKIPVTGLKKILRECQANESIIIDQA